MLTPEQMKIDVELCGHYLVLSRREEHLVNVMQCLEVGLDTSLICSIDLFQLGYFSCLDLCQSTVGNECFSPFGLSISPCLSH